MNLVIIGTGMAGYTLAREVRKKDPLARITLITRDNGDSYSKPMLSNALAVGKSPEQLILSPAAKMAAQYDLQVLVQTQVTGIDRDRQQVLTDQGPVDYDQLVLAWGAEQLHLPTAGDGADQVVRVNQIYDYQLFRERLAKADRVAIIGPGLIGCEFANDLLHADKQVTVIGPDPWPLASLLPETAGRFVEQKLTAAGVQWQLGQTVARIDQAKAGFTLTLSDDQHLEVDLVLSAVGLRPNVDLASAAGLTVSRGIVVNPLGQTDDPRISALGDCAQYGERWLPYIMPIMHAARALAATLTGTPTDIVFPLMPVAVKTPAVPISLVPAPPGARWSFIEQDEGLVGRAKLDERTVGFVLLGPQTLRQSLVKELS